MADAWRSSAGAPPAWARSEHFASLGDRHRRAAIVQGTRTPPSHGGNPGSNPGSGTQEAPGVRGLFSLSRLLGSEAPHIATLMPRGRSQTCAGHDVTNTTIPWTTGLKDVTNSA